MPTSRTCPSRAPTRRTRRLARTVRRSRPPQPRLSPFVDTQLPTSPEESSMLAQKSAIVTGSTSGIGLGIARAFAQQGADVMLNGFGNADEIEFTRSELQREFGVQVLHSGADMSRPEQIRAMADLSAARFGKVDIVVNNAGIQ